MVDGGSSKGCSRLCGLVGRYLRRHAMALVTRGRLGETLSSSTEKVSGNPPTLSKEVEKDLLISLTAVCREIKRWTTEVECDYEQADVMDHNFNDDCSCRLELPLECQGCTANIVSLLVVFLTSNSQYVSHMAGKVMAAISYFLMQYVSKWEEFIHLLWISLQISINSIASLASAESVVCNAVCYPYNKDEASAHTEGSYCDAHFVTFLRSRLENPDWLMPAALAQVLHIIQKSLKNEDGGLAQSYLHFAVFSLLNIPWSLLSKICAAQTSGLCSAQNTTGGDLGKMEMSSVFLGAVLQLLCSLVEQNNLEAGYNPLDESPVYSKVTNLVPELLVCCFSNRHRYDPCMYQYLRHKVLVLMIRLSTWSHWQHSSLVSWLQFLQKYFKDILQKPISRCHAVHSMPMEGSPFLTAISGGGNVENICTIHLQRQTIFLFLKCCFALIRFDKQACHECTCGLLTACTCERKHVESCSFNILSDMSGWLRRHVPLDNYPDDLIYEKLCRRFSLSFLQLYMEEDDLLFEMLLQLLDAPFPTMQGKHSKHDNLCEEMGKNISFHISNIFNPIHLFHQFLTLIHYDHLVLLDYLISKDTGIHFVHYLLRCVRAVCKSWTAFVEFSMCCTGIDQPHSKRRKLCINGQDCSETLGLTVSVIDGSNDFRVLKNGDGRVHNFGCEEEEYSARPKQMFQDAKECLLALKTSVEDLHGKNLFPYNPAPLLRSFSRFQELCEAEQSKIDGLHVAG